MWAKTHSALTNLVEILPILSWRGKKLPVDCVNAEWASPSTGPAWNEPPNKQSPNLELPTADTQAESFHDHLEIFRGRLAWSLAPVKEYILFGEMSKTVGKKYQQTKKSE